MKRQNYRTTAHPKDNKPNPPNVLNEEELIQKARLAINLMAAATSDQPDGLCFTSIRKLVGSNIILELNNNNTVQWLKQPDIQRTL